MSVVSLDTPVGGEQDAPTGPEIFDSFKDAQGRFRTQSLFLEYPHESYPAFFTLKKFDKEKDGVKYTSLYRKYMEIGDPTEYQVAQRLFGSWDHWQALCKAKWFSDELTGWREELQVRMESQRFIEMELRSQKDDATGIQATKWLADRYGEKSTAKRGRPSKAEKESHLKRLAKETEQLEDDSKRIGL